MLCRGCGLLDQYSSAFRDWYKARGLFGSSIQRNFTIQELDLDCRNAFAGIYLGKDDLSQLRQLLSRKGDKKRRNDKFVISYNNGSSVISGQYKGTCRLDKST